MSNENKKFDVKFENGNLILGLDTNQDGEKLIDISVNMNEAIQEALQRGESVKIEGAKVVAFEFNMASLKLIIDTDQDGEKLLDISINLAEAIDEAGLMKSE